MKIPVLAKRNNRKKRVLAVASGGGHWEQLMLINPALNNCDVHYATTMAGLPERAEVSPSTIIPDCSRDDLLANVRCTVKILRLFIVYRPDIVVSTGAAPGLISLFVGKISGARTIWIDSIANSEEMSLSGRVATYFADVCLTQWEHLSRSSRKLKFMGCVL